MSRAPLADRALTDDAAGTTLTGSAGFERAVRIGSGEAHWVFGPLRIREPVQVMAVIDEPGVKGFAYGTLAGHPVQGEESFVVERRTDGSVWLTIRSNTRPACGLWWVAYPAALVAQRVYRRRYFGALTAPG